MSKKRFSEGLDDLLNNAINEAEEAGRADQHAASRATDRRLQHKNFIADLDSLLQEALDEEFESDQPAEALPKNNKSRSAVAQQGRLPLSGLDILIRQTVDIQSAGVDEQSGKKRLTVAVDKIKLDKLKTIARLENSYLKDLLIELIDDYIEKYKNRKGLPL